MIGVLWGNYYHSTCIRDLGQISRTNMLTWIQIIFHFKIIQQYSFLQEPTQKLIYTGHISSINVMVLIIPYSTQYYLARSELAGVRDKFCKNHSSNTLNSKANLPASLLFYHIPLLDRCHWLRNTAHVYCSCHPSPFVIQNSVTACLTLDWNLINMANRKKI